MITVMQRGTVRGRVNAATLRRRAARLLTALDRADDDLCLLLTDDAEIQALNLSYRQKDKPTDVLSFSQLEGADRPVMPPGVPIALGDVVISLETAEAQVVEGCLPRLWAAMGNPDAAPAWTLLDEVTFLLVHGTLHLLGHDHEVDETQRAVMEAEEARLLAEVSSGGRARRRPQGAPPEPGAPARTARPR